MEKHGAASSPPRNSSDKMIDRSDRMWGQYLLGAIVCTVAIMVTNASSILFFVSFSIIIFILNASFLFAEGRGTRSYNKYTAKNSQKMTNLLFPDATAVIFAYLPNEQHIICDTIEYFLREALYDGTLQVILAYNTDRYLDVIDRLEEIESKHNNFRMLHVKNSKRKATNLNSIVNEISTPIVGFFDADSRPAQQAFSKAYQWIIRGYDFVQGSNNIGNKATNFLTRLISSEFTLKYHGAYVGRYHAFGVSYFCGSNGYWRTETVKRLKANENAQVEDIDMAVRAMVQGATLAYDPSIWAYEEAPTTIISWWRQRVRWAQGWAQLLVWHQANIIKTDAMSLISKLIWSFFLVRRFLLPWAFSTVLIGFLLHLIFEIPFTQTELVSLSTLFCVQIVGSLYVSRYSLRSLISMNHCDRSTISSLLIYSFVFPLYDIIRMLTILRGSLALLYIPTIWYCTPRMYERHSRRLRYDE